MACPLFLPGACKVTMQQLTLMATFRSSDKKILGAEMERWNCERCFYPALVKLGWKLLLKIA